jgi:hypothetical protein
MPERELNALDTDDVFPLLYAFLLSVWGKAEWDEPIQSLFEQEASVLLEAIRL